jgi:hypothetical protein
MTRFTAFISMLGTVILRKCIYIYHEYSYLLRGMLFLLVSAWQFSGMIFLQNMADSGRVVDPITSTISMGRPDR